MIRMTDVPEFIFFLDKIKKMSTTTTIEPKKESLGISAALILSLVGLTVSKKY
jgi:hypothetical protein